MNGMALHGGVLPVGGTFFVFSDYMRPGAAPGAPSARRRSIYSFTHDSVGVGEDGPTHQPVEHLASLRAIPGLRVIRPADANETAAAWRVAVDGEGPVALVLSRQDLPVVTTPEQAAGRRSRAPTCCQRDRRRATTATPTSSTSCSSAPAARSRCASRPPTLLEAEGLRVRVVSHAELGPVRAARRRLPGRGAAPRRADAGRRGGVDVRLGPLGRRRRGDRPLRRLGARARSCSRSSGFTAGNVVARALELLDEHRRGRRATRTTDGHACTTCYEMQGQSPWLDNLKRGLDHLRRAPAVGRPRRARHHVEPDDLPEGDRRLAPTTTSSSASLVERRDVGRGRATGRS